MRSLQSAVDVVGAPSQGVYDTDFGFAEDTFDGYLAVAGAQNDGYDVSHPDAGPSQATPGCAATACSANLAVCASFCVCLPGLIGVPNGMHTHGAAG